MGAIACLIRSYRGSDEARRRLCYDQHHVWMVTVGVTLPETLPCILTGRRTGGQGQFLTRIVALYPAILDIATSLSLNTLFGCRAGAIRVEGDHHAVLSRWVRGNAGPRSPPGTARVRRAAGDQSAPGRSASE